MSKTVLASIRHSLAIQSSQVRKLSIGSQLMRQWRGRTYKVEVCTQGYVHNGVAYKSLSAISKHITGVDYSGYRFFGLKKANLKRLESKVL